jgi:hypothetical protein
MAAAIVVFPPGLVNVDTPPYEAETRRVLDLSRLRGVGRGVNLAMAALFLASAGLQLNDPDPLRWIAVYSGAAVACIAADRAPRAWIPAAAIGLVAMAWASTTASVLPRMKGADLFRSMKAETPVIEESREFLGLLVVAGWMTWLTVRALRARCSGAPPR